MKQKIIKYLLILLPLILVGIYFPNLTTITPDGIGYYSYLPAIWEKSNLDFYDYFAEESAHYFMAVSNTGYIINLWPAGNSVLCTPIYLFSLLFKNPNISLILANFFCSLAGLSALYFIFMTLLFLNLDKKTAFFITIAAYFATPLFYYSYYSSQIGHSVTAGLAALFFYIWLKTFGQSSLPRWCLLGFILGVLTSVRTQEVLFGVVMFIELAYFIAKKIQVKQHIINAACAVAMFIAGFSPQMVIWKIMYGSFLANPESFNLNISNFSLIETIFSPFHGLVFWTPGIILGIISLLPGFRKDFIAILALLAAFLAQLFINSFRTSFWDGYSFGIRLLTSSVWIIGFGFGIGYRSIRKKPLKIAYLSLIGLFALWSLFLAIGGMSLATPFNLKLFISSVVELKNNILHNIVRFLIPQLQIKVFMLAIFTSIAGLVLYLLTKADCMLKKRNMIIALALCIIYVCIFNLKLVSVSKNRVMHKDSSMFITPDDLSNISLLFDLKTGVQYYSLAGNDRKMNSALERIKNIRFQTDKCKYIYNKFLDSIPELAGEEK